MQSTEQHPLDDTTTPVLVCGVLAGLAGAVAGMVPLGLFFLIRGDGVTMPARLVAASLMGRDALERDNTMAATLLGLLITIIAASAAGALFTFLRRREARFRLLIAEGVGFGLVLFGALWLTLPYLNPVMFTQMPWVALAISYAIFGATLASELPLRVGSVAELNDPESVRRSLSA
jgi:hypothetical protein